MKKPNKSKEETNYSTNMPNQETMEEKLKFIRDSCEKANPEESQWVSGSCRVSLRDILFTISCLMSGGTLILELNSYFEFFFEDNPDTHWNLKNDDLTEQSNKCVDYLYNLFKNEERNPTR